MVDDGLVDGDENNAAEVDNLQPASQGGSSGERRPSISAIGAALQHGSESDPTRSVNDDKHPENKSGAKQLKFSSDAPEHLPKPGAKHPPPKKPPAPKKEPRSPPK